MRDRGGDGGKRDKMSRGEQRTVAFVDILGFSEEVNKLGRRPAGFPRIVKALLGASTAGDFSADENDVFSILVSQQGEKYEVDLQYAFFSDCTYVSARSVAGGTDKVLSVVIDYARRLLMRGFFVRGGIARGLAAQREGMVVGPAVLTAYSIELKAAVYPRIVIEDAIARDLLAIADKPNATATIRRGEDGLYFVDVLTTLGQRDDGEAILQQARKLILERLSKRRSLDIDAKWRWLAAQYNRAMRLASSKEENTLLPIEGPDVVELPKDL